MHMQYKDPQAFCIPTVCSHRLCHEHLDLVDHLFCRLRSWANEANTTHDRCGGTWGHLPHAVRADRYLFLGGLWYVMCFTQVARAHTHTHT